ncbi:hypothetical protein FACS1894202_05870 [Clostridia bacterium]|nr:hypothetical protein FACS1894202_05870 [Clostridia bacterium]
MDLFRKDIDPRCAYCSRGRPMGRGDVACFHRGVVKEHFHCKKFRYDPLRRVPPKPVTLDHSYTRDDFTL